MISDLNMYLKNKAEELVKKSGLHLSLIIEEIPGDLQAGFNKIDQTVSINLRKVIINSQRERVEVSDYLEVIICHELGHAVDPELTMEVLQKIASVREVIYEKLEQLDDLQGGEHDFENIKQELLSQVEVLEELEYPAEERACEFGRVFVSKHLLEIYDEHSMRNLQTYKENYKNIK
ncbi:hypothetical protein [Priestia megaterium]|uniref:hypothetical protein n=1 Tax=Priestia megaterium TaxID=1404 RepID=UPI000E2E955D|nr:hypothetical protein [Priestia megaterium]MED4051537.1 hypothetical protein [Priestia megaterium]RFB41310.1 hypothetical protein DZB86_10880 [Bacillus sp. RC]